jgi:hypothetical protein
VLNRTATECVFDIVTVLVVAVSAAALGYQPV